MKFFILSAATLAFASCATTNNNTTITEQKSTQVRNVAQAANQSLANKLPSVNLSDVASANSGYWSVKKGTTDFFGRYKAYIVSTPDKDYNDLYVFAETDALENLPKYKTTKISKDEKAPQAEVDSEFNLIAKNSNFVWGGSFGGTEPTLTTNKKGSLVIQSMNEGIGRSAWNEQVIARFNPVSAKIEVIGYEYVSYDKLDGSGLNCSFNYNTGVGYVSITPVQIDDNGNEKKPLPKTIKKTVKVPTAMVDLNVWQGGPNNKMTSACNF